MLNWEKLPIEVFVVFALIIIAAFIALIKQKANAIGFIAILAAVIIAAVALAYEDPGNDSSNNPPTENTISFSQSTIDVEVGDYQDLINYIEGDHVSFSSLEWNSSDPAIVIVDQSGRILGMKEGGAIITVSADNNADAKCFINVTDNNGSDSDTEPPEDTYERGQDEEVGRNPVRESQLDVGLVDDLGGTDIDGIAHPKCIGLYANERDRDSSITYYLEGKYDEIRFDYYACGINWDGYNKLIILRDSETEDLDGHGYEIAAIPKVNKSGSFIVPISGVDRLTILYKCTDEYPNHSPGVLLENILFY